MGKAAMLIEPGMTFSGPHAEALKAVGAALYARFKPLHEALAVAPTLGVRLHFGAVFELQGQDPEFLLTELTEEAAKAQVTVDELRSELGKQVILHNVWGYLTLTAITEVGQWSVAAQHFPPLSRAIAAYAAANPIVWQNGRMPDEILRPQPWRTAWIIYPGFLLAGGATLVLTLMSPALFFWGNLWDSRLGLYCGVAVFFSVMCHVYSLFISLANVWTPRYLMAVFPQLEVIAACLLLMLARFGRQTDH